MFEKSVRWISREVWFWLLLALGLATAFFRIDAHGLWGDEVWQALWSRQQDIAATIARFSAPPDFPLHFILVQFSTSQRGDAFWVRLPSALLGAFTVPLLAVLGTRVFSRKVGILSAVLLAFAPFHVWFAQDARPYAALAFYSLLSLLFFSALLKNFSWQACAGLALATALNLYNHFFSLMPILSQTVSIAILLGGAWWQAKSFRTQAALEWRRKAFGFAVSIGAALLLAAPLWRGYAGYILARAPGEVQAAPFQVTPAFLTELYGMFGGGTGWSLAVFAGLSVLGLYVAARRRNGFAWVGALWLALPLLILSIAQPRHIFIPRYFLYMQPVYFLFVAYGIVTLSEWFVLSRKKWFAASRIPAQSAATVLLTGVVLVALIPPMWQSYWVERLNDWGTMCAFLHRNAQPGDAVTGDGYIVGLMLWCYPNPEAVPVIDGNRVPPASLLARGLNLWYLNMDPATSENWLTENFELVPRSTWGKNDLIVTSASGDFQYLQAERVARLWHYKASSIPSRIVFDDVREKTGGQGYAELGKFMRYAVRLRLPATAPRSLRLTVQERSGGNVRVLVNDEIVGRFLPKNDSREWRTLEFPLPENAGETFLVELVNATGTGARVREIQAVYADKAP